MSKTKVINKNSDEKNDHEFDIVMYTRKNKDIVYEMSYSQSTVWLMERRGQTIITAVDNGNGIKFKFHENYDFKQLEYCEASAMFIMLKFIQKSDNAHRFKFKT